MSDEKDYSFEELNPVFSLYDNFIEFNKECVDFVDKVNEDNFKNYEDILKKQEDTLSFNIFKVFTKQWKYENFHSEAIKFLLEFNQGTLNDFLLFLNEQKTLEGKKLSTQINIENYINAILECEHVIKNQRRIDILITGHGSKDEKHAIIIENKINNAKDQEGQLHDYYNYMKKTYTVDCIIYLVPNKEIKPNDNSLGIEEEIKRKLIILPSFSGNTNDLVTSLEFSLSNLESKTEQKNSNEENYRVFLNNYIDLLKYTGAGDMDVVANKFLEELKEKVKEDPKQLNKVYYIKEMLDNLPRARIQFFIDELKFGENYKNSNQWFYRWYYTNIKETHWIEIFVEVTDVKKTKVIIYDHDCYKKQDKKVFEKLKNLLSNKKITYYTEPSEHYDSTETCCKTFKFPEEDEKAVEYLKKLDNILSNWEK